MNTEEEEFITLIVHLCRFHLGQVPNDSVTGREIVTYLEQRGLLKKPLPPPQLNPVVAEVIVGQQLLEVPDAAELLNVSTKWIYRHYRELPHILLGTGERQKIRFRRKALLDWIAQHEIDWRKKR